MRIGGMPSLTRARRCASRFQARTGRTAERPVCSSVKRGSGQSFAFEAQAKAARLTFAGARSAQAEAWSVAEWASRQRTSSAAVRRTLMSPAWIISWVTTDSRHLSRSSRIFSLGPISDIASISSWGIRAAASSFLPAR